MPKIRDADVADALREVRSRRQASEAHLEHTRALQRIMGAALFVQELLHETPTQTSAGAPSTELNAPPRPSMDCS